MTNVRSIAVVLLMGASGAAIAAPLRPPVSVGVHDGADGAYLVEGTFDVQAPAEVVWAVLTDYERISVFVKSVKKSVVLERTPERIVVAQEGVARVFIFSRKAHVTLWVTEEACHSIQFRDVSGRDFRSYEGRWDLGPTPGGLRVSYSLSAALKSKKSTFLVRAGVRGWAKALLEEVRAEIGRRYRDGASGSQVALGTK